MTKDSYYCVDRQLQCRHIFGVKTTSPSIPVRQRHFPPTHLLAYQTTALHAHTSLHAGSYITSPCINVWNQAKMNIRSMITDSYRQTIPSKLVVNRCSYIMGIYDDESIVTSNNLPCLCHSCSCYPTIGSVVNHPGTTRAGWLEKVSCETSPEWPSTFLLPSDPEHAYLTHCHPAFVPGHLEIIASVARPRVALLDQARAYQYSVKASFLPTVLLFCAICSAGFAGSFFSACSNMPASKKPSVIVSVNSPQIFS